MTQANPNAPGIGLPQGWYLTIVSPHGYGTYLKKVRTDSLGFGGAGGFFQSGRMTTYRVIFNGFMGGWVVDVDRREGQYLFGGKPFQDPIAAMVATETELSNV